MLGRLAKWLRLLGCDTLYARQETDHQIAARARAEGRVVLTRDQEMAKRKGIRSLLIHSDILEQQLREVAQAFDLSCQTSGPRCTQCNSRLEMACRDAARPHVPPFVYRTHSQFHYCPQCTRYFWAGSHWKHIQETLAQIGVEACGLTQGSTYERG